MRRLLARCWLWLWRWSVVQQEPVPDRCVVIAAPHTSNWDFPITMAMAEVRGVPIRWLGKSQMFTPLLGPLFRRLGGLPVDRSSAAGMVDQLAAELSGPEPLTLVVPAEGTRGPVEYWKSGFHRIARRADVPIVCAFVDRSTRTGGFGPVIHPSGDVRADMDRIRAFYADKTGLRPGRFLVPRLREEDRTDTSGPSGPSRGVA